MPEINQRNNNSKWVNLIYNIAMWFDQYTIWIALRTICWRQMQCNVILRIRAKQIVRWYFASQMCILCERVCVYVCVCNDPFDLWPRISSQKPISLGRTENNIKMRAFHFDRKFRARIQCISSLHSGGHITSFKHMYTIYTSHGFTAAVDDTAIELTLPPLLLLVPLHM